MSDTPRSDAHSWHDGDYDDPIHAFYDFARQLERELNAANDRIKRLEEAGDAMAVVLVWSSGTQYKRSPTASAWRKAKEAKP